MLELPGVQAGFEGFLLPAGRHRRLVHEDPLAPLLVRSGFQRGQEVLGH